jgi:hypothetical protein
MHGDDRRTVAQDLRAAAPDRHDKRTAERRREARIAAGRIGWVAFQKGSRLRASVLYAMNLVAERKLRSMRPLICLMRFTCIFRRISCGDAIVR